MIFSEYKKESANFIEEIRNIKIDSDLINQFKENLIGINQFENSYITDVIDILKKRCKNEKNSCLEKYLNEVKIINQLYKEYYKSYINRQMIGSINYQSLFSFLLYINHLSYLCNIFSLRYRLEKNITQYEFNFMQMYEYYIYNISNIVKYLIRKNKIDFLKEFKYKLSYFCKKKFNLIEDSTFYIFIIKKIIDLWRNNSIEIIKSNSAIGIRITNIDEINKINVVERIYDNQQFFIVNASRDYLKYTPKTKFGNFISEKEFLGYVNLVNIFYDNSLCEKLENIECIIWLRVICLLIEKAKKEKKQRNKAANVFIKKMSYWLEFFEKYGIDRNDSYIIIQNLIFGKKTNDYFDSPFIMTNKGLAIFPEAVVNLNPARVIEEIMIRKNFSTTKKGENFENYVYSLLEMNDVKFIKIKEKKNKEEYQCDLVIFYKNEIYICELKNNMQSRSYSKYLQNKGKIFKDTTQVIRLYDYYKNNESLEKEFYKKYIEKIKISPEVKVYKMLIYSNIIGKCYMLNDVIICDIINFRDILVMRHRYPKKSIKKMILSNERYNLLLSEHSIKNSKIPIRYGEEIKVIDFEMINYLFVDNYDSVKNSGDNFLKNLNLYEKQLIQRAYLFMNNNCLDLTDTFLGFRYEMC